MSARPLLELDKQTAPSVVDITKAVGDVLRANVLKTLAADSFGVLELCEIFGTAQPAMSHHLKKLSHAGLVTKRREGTSVFYQRALPGSPLLSAVFAALDAEALAPCHEAAIQEIYDARAQRSQDFFAQSADALAQQTALICAPEVYADSVVQAALAVPAEARNMALEIGPGSGLLLRALAEHFNQVHGIDNAAEMLAKTQAAVADVDNITLHRQDFAALAAEPTYNLVAAAMVIHHMPSPLAFFQQAAQVLQADGLLVIAELGAHDQEWVKQLCGDVWLGFGAAQLARWASLSGFTEIQQQFLAQRNGFRVQVSAFALNSNPTTGNTL